MLQIPAPLEAMKFTDAIFTGGGGGSPEFKKRYIIEQGPHMLGKILPPDHTQKAYQQMAEMEGRKLLHIMSRDSFVHFLHQQGYTPKTYRFGTQGNGTNVEFEVRIQITSTNEAGLSCLLKSYMLDYLDAVHTVLKHERHPLELI